MDARGGEGEDAVVEGLSQRDGGGGIVREDDFISIHGCLFAHVRVAVQGGAQRVVGRQRGFLGIGLLVEANDDVCLVGEGDSRHAQLRHLHVAHGEATHLSGSHQVGADAEVVVVGGLHGGAGAGILADGLDIAHGAVLLQRDGGEVVPCALQRAAIFHFREDAVADAPGVGEGVQGSARCLIARCLSGVEERTCPVAFVLLAGLQRSCHATVVGDVLVAVCIACGQLLQHLGEGSEDPAVAACPEVLLAGIGLMGGIDIFRIAEVETRILVVHDAVGVLPVGVHLVEVGLVARDVIELGHDRHHHEEAVHPPEVVGVCGRDLVAHDLQGALNLLCVVDGVEVVEVGIDLEAHLVVAEEHPVGTFAVGGISPSALVRACGTPPVAAVGPGCGVVEVVGIAGGIVGCHVTDVIDGTVPEVVAVCRVFLLPCLVDGIQDGHHVVLRRQRLHGGGCEGLLDCLLETAEGFKPSLVAVIAPGREDVPSAAEVEGQLCAHGVVHHQAEVVVNDLGRYGS